MQTRLQKNVTPSFTVAARTLADITLRARCRAACDQFPGAPRLRDIAAVGALDAEIGGYGVDSQRLTATLHYLLDSGFLIDPDFKIDVINFRDNRNFLIEDKPTDLIYVGYIIRHHDRLMDSFEFSPAPAPRDTNTLICMLSRRHDAPHWGDRARQSGAKMIFAYGGSVEINAGMFCDPLMVEDPYHLLIDNPDEECMGGFTRLEMKTLYPDHPGIDLPIAGLGFCADAGYLADIQPALTRKTCLSRAALIPPVARPVLELQRNDICLDRAQRANRRRQRHHRP